jgi:hypothetical protein
MQSRLFRGSAGLHGDRPVAADGGLLERFDGFRSAYQRPGLRGFHRSASGEGDGDRRGANVIGHGTRARPWAAQGKLLRELRNYAPENKRVQGKIKKFEISLDKNVESGIHSLS